MKFINLENFQNLNYLKSTFLKNLPYLYIVIDNFFKSKYIEKLNKTELKNLILQNCDFITKTFFINLRNNYNYSFINTSR